MSKGVCEYCKKDFRKREQKRRFCSLSCSSRFNKNGVKLITLPAHDSDLAELIGICLGDGCAWGYQTCITLGTVNDKTYIPYVVDLIRKIFPEVSISLVNRKNEKALDIRINSKIATDFMKSMGIVSRNKQVPAWIYKDPDCVKACLRGLIDTDGTFIIHKYSVKGRLYQYLKISFTNKSENLLNFLDQGLRSMGIKSYRTYKYQVWIHNREDVEKYLAVIGTGNIKENIIKFQKSKPALQSSA